MTPDTLKPPAPPPFSWRDTLRRACVGGGDEKWMSGVVEECVRGVRRQGYTSLSRQPHADCLQVFCRGVRFTFHLVGDRQSLTLMYFWTLCAIGGKPYEAVYKLSASDGLSAFLFHSAWRVFPFLFLIKSSAEQLACCIVVLSSDRLDFLRF